MKKYLILFFAFFSTFGFSQQVLLKRSSTQFFFLCLANGDSLTNLCGNNNFSTNYNNYSIAIEYQTITMSLSTSTSVNITNETINSTNFNWLNPGIVYTSTAITNPYPLKFTIKSVWADCNNDGTKDALYIIIDFPMTQTNGSSIPVGTKINFNTPQLNNSISGSLLLNSTSRWFEWDGIQWNQSDLYGTYSTVSVNWESTFLSIDDFERGKTVSLFPNPSKNFITIQNKLTITEKFEYKIIDFTGRIVKSGNSKFNEQINIECLTSGNYIIQIETETGKKSNKKLIKN